MSIEKKQLPQSKVSAIKTLFAAFEILKAEGGQLPGKEIVSRISQKVELTEWEKYRFEKTGYIRWESILHFTTIDAIKAGFMQKSKGVWYLTPEGEQVMKKGDAFLFDEARRKYREWAEKNKTAVSEKVELAENDEADTDTDQSLNIELLEEQALQGIRDYLIAKTPYEFQDMAAALLRAMGYYTPFTAKKGKDGGIDVIAYQDPLGHKTPRIKVQVKHYPENPIAAETIRSLKGLINSGEEVGLFVTSGRFSNEAERFAREANVHIKLINGIEFIELWQEFYPKMTDEDKNMLPLKSIYFLGVNN